MRNSTFSRNVLLATFIVSSMAALPGCTSTLHDDSGENDHSGYWFSTKDGDSIPGQPARCGPEIAADEIEILNVREEAKPREFVRATFPAAQFATDDYVLIAVRDTPAKTQEKFSRYLAGRGCDLVVYGEFETTRKKNAQPITLDRVGGGWEMTMRVIWGSREIGQNTND